MTPSRTQMSILALLLSLGALVGLSACGSTADEVAMGPDVTVIDVRTPEEFALGHLDGAVNMNLQSGSFEQDITALDKDGKFIIYCRSGNRSAQATTIMKDAGFNNIHDAGSVEDASQYTGLDVVTGP